MTLSSTSGHHHQHFHKALHRLHTHGSWIGVEAFVWKEVGGLYPYLDIPSGICLVLGSIILSVVPLLHIVRPQEYAVTYNAVLMVGVVLFTLAKFFVELRAAYARLFKGPSSWATIWYHLGILGSLIGGVLFGIVLVLLLVEADDFDVSCVSMASSVMFVAGSFCFCVDAWPDFWEKGPYMNKYSAIYMWGSTWFLIGSFCYVAASGISYTTFEEADLHANIWSLAGGVFFLFGASFFFGLGVIEMHEFQKGPSMNLPHVRRRCERLGIDYGNP
tara:strand:+ start:1228 stop:2049 length:822 start_codon:yes stop_codon:yes gene_type:complete